MIVSKEEKVEKRIEIDLSGPHGNAYVLLGYARRWAKQFGMDADAIQKEMTSGDYNHLVSVLDKHFGDYIILYR